MMWESSRKTTHIRHGNEIKTNPKYSMLVLIAAWQDANPRKRAAAGHHHLPWWQKPNMELEKGSQGR